MSCAPSGAAASRKSRVKREKNRCQIRLLRLLWVEMCSCMQLVLMYVFEMIGFGVMKVQILLFSNTITKYGLYQVLQRLYDL
jgi:hypothetical protein